MPNIPAQLERISAVYETELTPHTQQRIGAMRQIARTLSRKGQAAAKVELANAALVALAEVLFESDDDGEYANLDAGGRVLIPLPWGRAGSRFWGLRTSEAKALRYIMMQRALEPHAWMRYEGETRNWYVSIPSRRHAAAVLRAQPITAHEWRIAWTSTKTAWAAERLAYG